MNETGDVLENRTVLVEDDAIVAVVHATAIELDPETTVINGSGRTLMPGLVDMHVHLRTADLPEYVEHGVTMVRNCWGWEGLQDLMSGAVAGEIVSPTIHSLSPGVDGTPPSWPQTQIIMDPAEAPALVERLQGDNWMGLKMYQNLRREVYDAVVAAADARGVSFSGHVPHRVGIDRVSLQAELDDVP